MIAHRHTARGNKNEKNTATRKHKSVSAPCDPILDCHDRPADCHVWLASKRTNSRQPNPTQLPFPRWEMNLAHY